MLEITIIDRLLNRIRSREDFAPEPDDAEARDIIRDVLKSRMEHIPIGRIVVPGFEERPGSATGRPYIFAGPLGVEPNERTEEHISEAEPVTLATGFAKLRQSGRNIKVEKKVDRLDTMRLFGLGPKKEDAPS